MCFVKYPPSPPTYHHTRYNSPFCDLIHSMASSKSIRAGRKPILFLCYMPFALGHAAGSCPVLFVIAVGLLAFDEWNRP